ncbi:GNAT family N-acetyltransferase [Streptacidiphilus sp. P02-A3a]|uniref:GNAT family N-acetyltransferase n=1 Tax=Streptacidiphilus sp. P02-A3a TaxID=2704468 RepID=UPI001CDD388C|nr:GNAT family N-acetyltransferase [Streptacidiphilus sp. P02-A3a]
MIDYSDDLTGLTEDQLHGFFVGWPSPPTRAQHLAVLHGSYRAVIARETATGQVVGFVNLISDGVLTAFIPWLEVLPAHQGHGIGAELIRQVLVGTDHLYSIDLTCDAGLRPYYERLGLLPLTGMAIRHWDVLPSKVV